MLLLERKRVEVDKGTEFKVAKDGKETGAAVWIDTISSVDEKVKEEVEVEMGDRGAADGNVDDSEVVIFCGYNGALLKRTDFFFGMLVTGGKRLFFSYRETYLVELAHLLPPRSK